jgi:filamentous hemagglutinin
MLKSAVEEVRTSSAAAKAEAQAIAIAIAKVENNLGRDGALDPYAPVPNAQAQADVRAKAAADAANGVSNPHYDAKHGPGTTLERQYQRAMNGTNPQTGGNGAPADASKFFNATDMQTAIKQAEAAYVANPTNFPDGNVHINFNRPIGEGYTGKTRTNRDNGTPIGEYRWSTIATVRIDLPTAKAYTAYPNLGLGAVKPDPLNNGARP